MDAHAAAQLFAIRLQLDALSSQFDALAAALGVTPEGAGSAYGPTPSEKCPHIETEAVGTFGEVEQRCVACGAIVQV